MTETPPRIGGFYFVKDTLHLIVGEKEGGLLRALDLTHPKNLAPSVLDPKVHQFGEEVTGDAIPKDLRNLTKIYINKNGRQGLFTPSGNFFPLQGGWSGEGPFRFLMSPHPSEYIHRGDILGGVVEKQLSLDLHDDPLPPASDCANGHFFSPEGDSKKELLAITPRVKGSERLFWDFKSGVLREGSLPHGTNDLLGAYHGTNLFVRIESEGKKTLGFYIEGDDGWYWSLKDDKPVKLDPETLTHMTCDGTEWASYGDCYQDLDLSKLSHIEKLAKESGWDQVFSWNKGDLVTVGDYPALFMGISEGRPHFVVRTGGTEEEPGVGSVNTMTFMKGTRYSDEVKSWAVRNRLLFFSNKTKTVGLLLDKDSWTTGKTNPDSEMVPIRAKCGGQYFLGPEGSPNSLERSDEKYLLAAAYVQGTHVEGGFVERSDGEDTITVVRYDNTSRVYSLSNKANLPRILNEREIRDVEIPTLQAVPVEVDGISALDVAMRYGGPIKGAFEVLDWETLDPIHPKRWQTFDELREKVNAFLAGYVGQQNDSHELVVGVDPHRATITLVSMVADDPKPRVVPLKDVEPADFSQHPQSSPLVWVDGARGVRLGEDGLYYWCFDTKEVLPLPEKFSYLTNSSGETLHLEWENTPENAIPALVFMGDPFLWSSVNSSPKEVSRDTPLQFGDAVRFEGGKAIFLGYSKEEGEKYVYLLTSNGVHVGLQARRVPYFPMKDQRDGLPIYLLKSDPSTYGIKVEGDTFFDLKNLKYTLYYRDEFLIPTNLDLGTPLEDIQAFAMEYATSNGANANVGVEARKKESVGVGTTTTIPTKEADLGDLVETPGGVGVSLGEKSFVLKDGFFVSFAGKFPRYEPKTKEEEKTLAENFALSVPQTDPEKNVYHMISPKGDIVNLGGLHGYLSRSFPLVSEGKRVTMANVGALSEYLPLSDIITVERKVTLRESSKKAESKPQNPFVPLQVSNLIQPTFAKDPETGAVDLNKPTAAKEEEKKVFNPGDAVLFNTVNLGCSLYNRRGVITDCLGEDSYKVIAFKDHNPNRPPETLSVSVTDNNIRVYSGADEDEDIQKLHWTYTQVRDYIEHTLDTMFENTGSNRSLAEVLARHIQDRLNEKKEQVQTTPVQALPTATKLDQIQQQEDEKFIAALDKAVKDMIREDEEKVLQQVAQTVENNSKSLFKLGDTISPSQYPDTHHLYQTIIGIYEDGRYLVVSEDGTVSVVAISEPNPSYVMRLNHRNPVLRSIADFSLFTTVEYDSTGLIESVPTNKRLLGFFSPLSDPQKSFLRLLSQVPNDGDRSREANIAKDLGIIQPVEGEHLTETLKSFVEDYKTLLLRTLTKARESVPETPCVGKFQDMDPHKYPLGRIVTTPQGSTFLVLAESTPPGSRPTTYGTNDEVYPGSSPVEQYLCLKVISIGSVGAGYTYYPAQVEKKVIENPANTISTDIPSPLPWVVGNGNYEKDLVGIKYGKTSVVVVKPGSKFHGKVLPYEANFKEIPAWFSPHTARHSIFDTVIDSRVFQALLDNPSDPVAVKSALETIHREFDFCLPPLGNFLENVETHYKKVLSTSTSSGSTSQPQVTSVTTTATTKTKEEKDQPMPTPPPAPSNKTPSTVLATLKVDGQEAGLRVAAKQVTKLVQDPLCALMARNLGDDSPEFRAKVSHFLGTEIGACLVQIAISGALSTLPMEHPLKDALARELRVSALAGGMDTLAEVLIGPLREVTALYLRGIPETPAELPSATGSGQVNTSTVDTHAYEQ